MNKYGYGRQTLDDSDRAAVMKILNGDFLTCGPEIEKFENAIAAYVGARYCVAVSNATAALHLACLALELGPGDEGITSPITFLSSANCLHFCGAKAVFADIDPETANIDPEEIAKKITPATKVIIPVHFAGQSCDMEAIGEIAQKHNLHVIEDAAHALGSACRGEKTGSCKWSDMTVFSFHPVKTITTGEGGAITTNNEEVYHKLKALRAHGMYKDGAMRDTWEYEMRDLGYNYRMTDIQAALGLSQMGKLAKFKKRRREIVDWYNHNLNLPHLEEKSWSDACFHLYPVLVRDRENFYHKARGVGLNLQVHYIPVHLQPYYRRRGHKLGDYPKAEAYYERCISLPLYPSLTNDDLEEIAARIKSIL